MSAKTVIERLHYDPDYAPYFIQTDNPVGLRDRYGGMFEKRRHRLCCKLVTWSSDAKTVLDEIPHSKTVEHPDSRFVFVLFIDPS
jgi:hypothetical protein